MEDVDQAREAITADLNRLYENANLENVLREFAKLEVPVPKASEVLTRHVFLGMLGRLTGLYDLSKAVPRESWKYRPKVKAKPPDPMYSRMMMEMTSNKLEQIANERKEPKEDYLNEARRLWDKLEESRVKAIFGDEKWIPTQLRTEDEPKE